LGHRGPRALARRPYRTDRELYLRDPSHRASHPAPGSFSDFVQWGRCGGLKTLALYGWSFFSLLARLRWGRVELEALTRHRTASLEGAGRSDPPRVYNYGVRVHNRSRRRMVDSDASRMRFGMSGSAGLPPRAGERSLLSSKRAPRCPSRKSSWSTVHTRTAICCWSYAATSVATASLACVDPTGTSSSTRG
jgi:hypothetical protein